VPRLIHPARKENLPFKIHFEAIASPQASAHQASVFLLTGQIVFYIDNLRCENSLYNYLNFLMYI